MDIRYVLSPSDRLVVVFKVGGLEVFLNDQSCIIKMLAKNQFSKLSDKSQYLSAHRINLSKSTGKGTDCF